MSEAARRPVELRGPTYDIKMPHCGHIFTTVNLPLEILVRMGKSGDCQRAWIEAVGRLASLALRYGVPAEDIVKELKGIQCPGSQPPSRQKGKGCLSCPDAIAKCIEDALEEGNIESVEGKIH